MGEHFPAAAAFPSLVDNDGSATESMCLIAVKRAVGQGAYERRTDELAAAAVTAFHSDN